jgi:hypothetical protein
MAKIANPNAPVLEAPAPEMVTVRVLKKGDGKIGTGDNEYGRGDYHYERNETFECAKARAEELEELGYVETVDAPAPKPRQNEQARL